MTDAREQIHEITFSLATGARVVEPPEITKALDAHRDESFTEAADLLRRMPIPAEAGDQWHWFDFARNRGADLLLAARTTTAQGS